MLFIRACIIACIALALTACGHSITMTTTADEAWKDTIGALRVQGLIPPSLDIAHATALERPRIDRVKGEIDLVYAESVYYGQGAAFITVDLDKPLEVLPRTVRLWVDYPVGNRVVRYGRSMDAKASAELFHNFERALATYRAAKTSGAAAPSPAPSPAN